LWHIACSLARVERSCSQSGATASVRLENALIG
jgi:hypothetical protein